MNRLAPIAGLTMSLVITCSSSLFAQPTVRQALSLVPMQQNDVVFDKPAEQQIDQCTIKPRRDGDARAWVVQAADGSLLRRFVDTNADNKIDLWCYYRNGVEVYRDIDGDYNEKADQYRWFATEGIRWAMDQDEDGKIDSWKQISAEEVTLELVRAIQTQDAKRFGMLLVSDEELEQLGVQDPARTRIRERVTQAQQQFAEFAKTQKDVAAETKWVDFSAPRPGIVPGGGDHTTQDLTVYENVLAMVETAGQHGQVPVGTLIRVGDVWRMTQLPDINDTGFFFSAVAREAAAIDVPLSSVDEKIQPLVQKLETLDQQLASATTEQAIREAYGKRAGALRDLVEASSGADRDMWLMQLIDSVVATAQPGDGDNAVAALEKLTTDVNQWTQDENIQAQARFAYMTAEYSRSLQQPDADFAKIQDKWIEDLEAFVKDFGGTRPAAEAMLQLAVSREFAGEDDAATTWYVRIVNDFGDTEMAEKAAGAKRRLESVGKPFELRGTGLDGRPFDVSSLRGNLVLVHYWATWCEPCKQEMTRIKDLMAQYGKNKFVAVGVNLDDQSDAAVAHLRSQRMGWPQLHEKGGLESKLAKEMGVFTLPVMLLVDENGAVVNRSITIDELENQLKQRTARK